jgi:hypothetical protein
VLAYVFWHWKQAHIALDDYETRQRAFHAALKAIPPAGFQDSFSIALAQKPWRAAEAAEVYEDWYLVQDFGALGTLNEGAISASRAVPHDAAAVVAAGGTGAVYGLRLGEVLLQPQYAHWFNKPTGISYQDFLAQMTALTASRQSALWMRQMVLGPAPEFCLHTTTAVTLAPELGAQTLALRG